MNNGVHLGRYAPQNYLNKNHTNYQILHIKNLDQGEIKEKKHSLVQLCNFCFTSNKYNLIVHIKSSSSCPKIYLHSQ